MQTGSVRGQQAAVWRGHKRDPFRLSRCIRYAMILNTLEKRALGGFPGEETHCMALASAKGKATLEGTKAAYFSAVGTRCLFCALGPEALRLSEVTQG